MTQKLDKMGIADASCWTPTRSMGIETTPQGVSDDANDVELPRAVRELKLRVWGIQFCQCSPGQGLWSFFFPFLGESFLVNTWKFQSGYTGIHTEGGRVKLQL